MAERSSGILADHHIHALFASGALKSSRLLDADQIQPASLDLRLGAKAYRVRASFMPGPNKTVMDKLEQLKLHEIDLTDGAVLETGCVYVVPLLESLALPRRLGCLRQSEKLYRPARHFHPHHLPTARRSSTRSRQATSGPLYIEVSPRTFPIVVRHGSRLSQIRFRKGHALISEAATCRAACLRHARQ